MVMLILYNAESEIGVVRDIDLFIKEEESFRINGPMWGQGINLGRCDWIRGE